MNRVTLQWAKRIVLFCFLFFIGGKAINTIANIKAIHNINNNMNRNVNLTVIVKVSPNYLDEVKKMLQNMVVESRKEKACLYYVLHQSIEDPTIFIFHETWENEELLAIHNEQPYLKAFKKLIKEHKIIESPIIYRTQKL